MRITELWKRKGKPTISFELYPAHDDKGGAKLDAAIDKLAALEPDFVSVTFGAGGATREGSHALAAKLAREKRLDVLPYLAGYGLGPSTIAQVVDAYRELGLENLLVVRGDPPSEEAGVSPHPAGFAHASDLLAVIRARGLFCLGAAGYPEGHKTAESKEKDLLFLKLKQDSGAEFIITQYFYDNRFFFDFVQRSRAIGVTVPILPGVMPIYSVKMMESLAGLCGTTITDQVRGALAALPPGDKDAVQRFGTEFAVAQCRELLERGAVGLHFYTMDRSASVEEIVERLRKEKLI